MRRLEQLAEAGVAKSTASRIVGPEFGVSDSGSWIAMERGSVPAYPSGHPDRARAWLVGEVTYEGEMCPKHQTMTRYSNLGNCVECLNDSNKKGQRSTGPPRLSLSSLRPRILLHLQDDDSAHPLGADGITRL